MRAAFVGGTEFMANEVLTFVRCQGYSRYDDAFTYEFRSQQGEEKLWMANADLPAEALDRFMVLDGSQT